MRAGCSSNSSSGSRKYRELDRHILDLAVENTNLKAQRLSFGPAQDAATSFRDALEAVVPAGGASDTWRVKALVATAVASVREIQVLQAPHIADRRRRAMTRTGAARWRPRKPQREPR